MKGGMTVVGWLRWGENIRFFPRVSSERILGYPLLAVSLPVGDPAKRLAQGAKLLRRQRVRRVLAAPGLDSGVGLAGWGLVPVSTTPLCRALGARLALTALAPVPVRDRRVALRGSVADGLCRTLAETLCPQVGQLLLDFDRGEEALARRLRLAYGAAPLHLGPGAPPQVSLEFEPRPAPAGGRTFKLWGEPDLGGMALVPPPGLPPDLPALPFMDLLWEAGRLPLEEVALEERAAGP